MVLATEVVKMVRRTLVERHKEACVSARLSEYCSGERLSPREIVEGCTFIRKAILRTE